MNNDRNEFDIIRSQVSKMIDEGRQEGLDETEQAAINAEVDMLWARLSRARPRQRNCHVGITRKTGS